MSNETVLPLMRPPSKTQKQIIKVEERYGTPVDKGIVLNEDYLISVEPHLKKLFQQYSAYPDLFLDAIAPIDSNFKLFFYQRIMLRAMMRFKDVSMIACRATSKTFITILAMILQCIFIPNHNNFIAAPHKNQSAAIAKQKILEIYQRWPLLVREIEGCDYSDTPGNFGKDYVTLTFKNGSTFEVVGAAESSRGLRKHSQIYRNLFLSPLL